MRVCAEPGCPTLTSATRCQKHTRQRDRARGSSTARGYGGGHRKLRAAWQRRMDSGERVRCWRCTEVIAGPWQLGHCDDDHTKYHGPEHRACNLATAGRTHCPHPTHISPDG